MGDKINYDNLPEQEMTAQEWIEKTERWMTKAMNTMTNHKEALEAFEKRVAEVEEGLKALTALFKSAEEAAKEDSKKELFYLR